MPEQSIAEARSASCAALVGADTPQLQPRFEVAEGERVTAGQVLFRDRRHPEIAFVSPVSGRVTECSFGPRRTLSACVVEADAESAPALAQTPPEDRSEAALRHYLQERGLWPTLRTRPFGRTPRPHAEPAAIFVNAVHASPQMPDPRVVLNDQLEDFRAGLSVLLGLTAGNVHLCQSKGTPLAPEAHKLVISTFGGTRAAGLAGTQIDCLHPVTASEEVWSIDHQDVAAIGHLFQTGRYLSERVISVTGNAVAVPRLIRTSLGADISQLLADEPALADESRPVRLFSGDTYSGYESRFLGRFHAQVTLDKQQPKRSLQWLAGLLAPSGPLIPTAAVERAVAVDVLPVPLMRALSVGDSEAAVRLGCLSLVEEDLVTLSNRCISGADYGVLLRRVLDELMADAA